MIRLQISPKQSLKFLYKMKLSFFTFSPLASITRNKLQMKTILSGSLWSCLYESIQITMMIVHVLTLLKDKSDGFQD